MAKRRPNGDGMVRKSKGRWEGRIVVGHKKMVIQYSDMSTLELKKN